MKVYKLKHVPTGLFFCPVRWIKNVTVDRYCRSNLSTKGKVYTTLSDAKRGKNLYVGRCYSHLHDFRHGYRSRNLEVSESEIEIVEL